MNRIQKKCNPVQGIAWGQVPTATLDIGYRYRTILLEVIGYGRAAIIGNGSSVTPQYPARVLTLCDVLGDIVIKGNGNPWRTHSAWQLNAIQAAYGAQYAYNAYNYSGGVLHYTGNSNVPDAPVAGNQTIFYVPIYLREPWRGAYAAKDYFCWPTAWPDGSVLSSLTVEMSVPSASQNVATQDGTLTGQPVPLQINCYTEVDNMLGSVNPKTKKPVLNFNRWERSAAVYGGAGPLVISTLPCKDILSELDLFSNYAIGAGQGTQGGTYIGPVPGNTPAKILSDANDTATPSFDQLLSALVEVNAQAIRNVSNAVNNEFLTEDDFNESGMPPDALRVVFDKSDRPDDGLVLSAGGTPVKSFVVTVQVGQPGAAIVGKPAQVTIIRQSLGPPPGNS